MKDKTLNDFKGSTKVAIITDVDAQNKTVDITYLSQAGNYLALNLPYSTVGATWGHMFMPVKGDKVLVDTSQGGKPVIKAMYPPNTDLLPYLDPGEISSSCSNGSYIHFQNKRKRVQGTNEIVDYDADVGPNGETDLQYEAGGVIVRARSRKTQDNKDPSFYHHSYLGVFDNGDVALESMFQDKNKALIHMDGASGHLWLHAGDGKPQEYLELNPIRQEIVSFSDGDIHTLSQAYLKNVTYNDAISLVGGAFEFSSGMAPSSIGTAPTEAYFDQIEVGGGSYSGIAHPTLSYNPGDMIFNATSGTSGAGGQITLNAAQGISLYAYGPNNQGAILMQTQNDDITFNAINNGNNSTITFSVGGTNGSTITMDNNGNITITTQGSNNIFLNTTSANDDYRIATIHDIRNHTHALVPQALSIYTGTTPPLNGGTSVGVTPTQYEGSARAYLGLS